MSTNYDSYIAATTGTVMTTTGGSFPPYYILGSEKEKETISTLENRLQNRKKDLADLPNKEKALNAEIEQIKERLKVLKYQDYITKWTSVFPDEAPQPFNGTWEGAVDSMKALTLVAKEDKENPWA